MIEFIRMLKHHYRDSNDVCVFGILLMYFEEGEPEKLVVPDVLSSSE